MNYNIYKLSVFEKFKIFGLASLIGVVIAYLFYDSLYACVGVIGIYFFFRQQSIQNNILEQKQKLSQQFMDSLRSISTALLAGYSMENAWKEAQNEIGMLHGEDSLMYIELDEMNRAVKMSIPLEQTMKAFAERSGIEDIDSFSEIFSFAKRSGGNFVQIIDSTSYRMCEKYEIKREIEVMIASKKLEQKVMNVIPLIILGYLKITSIDYLSVLYGNILGALFMTICLMAYGLAIYISKKVLDIKV